MLVFQPSGVVVPRQANQLVQPSVTGQLAQTQTTDVLGAMPQYRPLPTGVRAGNGQEELVQRAVNVSEAIVQKLDESVNAQLQQDAQEIVSGDAGEVLEDLIPDLEHLKDMAEKVERIIGKALDS